MNQGALILKIIKGNYQPITNYSQELATLLKGCLCKTTQKRLSTIQILSSDFLVKKAKELGITLPSDIEVQSSSSAVAAPLAQIVKKENQQQPQSARSRNTSPVPVAAVVGVVPSRPTSAKKLVPMVKPPAVIEKVPSSHNVVASKSPVPSAAIGVEKLQEKIPLQQPQQLQIVKPPISAQQKKPILIPKPTPVVFPAKDVKKVPSQKEKEIEAVRNLPEFVVPSSKKHESPSIDEFIVMKKVSSPMCVEQVKENAIKPLEQQAVVAAVIEKKPPSPPQVIVQQEEKPIPCNTTPSVEESKSSEQQNVEKTPQTMNVSVSIEDEEPAQDVIVAQELIEQQSVTWSIHESNNEQQEEGKVELPNGKVIYEKSKPRIIDRLMQKIDELLSKKKQIVQQIEAKIGKEKTEALLSFFQKVASEDTEDEIAESEKIHKFVFGKIAFEDAPLVQDIYATIQLDERIAEYEVEVKDLLL